MLNRSVAAYHAIERVLHIKGASHAHLVGKSGSVHP